jgi:hypothetical protein
MLPLTFIAGVYGMNFEYMPELKWLLGYPFALAVMAIVAGAILWWFWRRGWLGGRDLPEEHAPAKHHPPKSARSSD